MSKKRRYTEEPFSGTLHLIEMRVHIYIYVYIYIGEALDCISSLLLSVIQPTYTAT